MYAIAVYISGQAAKPLKYLTSIFQRNTTKANMKWLPSSQFWATTSGKNFLSLEVSIKDGNQDKEFPFRILFDPLVLFSDKTDKAV